MKKNLILLVFILSALFFIGCKKPVDDVVFDYDNSQNLINMVVSVNEDNISISLSSNEEEIGTGTVNVYAMKAYQYLELDSINGLSKDVLSEGELIGTYDLGTTTKLEINRYEEEYDGLYNKYYLVKENKLLKGPVYATDVVAKVTDDPDLDIKSKKGVFGESVEVYKDLGCSYTTLDIDISHMIYPNELVEEGSNDVIPLSHPDDAIEFESNGVKYYFNRAVVEAFDKQVKSYYDLGASITAIIIATNNTDEESFPQSMTYAPWSTKNTRLMALNTSNDLGFKYFVALMEFLGEHYTKNDYENGYISNYILGNEIDYAKDYNRISEKSVSLDIYMEEYSRLLRLANLALKKNNSKITVAMPFTQWWCKNGYDVGVGVDYTSYAPKSMVDWLNKKTKLEGDYDWGIAPHSYVYGLAQADVYLYDTLIAREKGENGDYNTSTLLTFSNLEIIDMYLNQDELKCNGLSRSVYLTESGVSSLSNNEIDQAKQAAYISAIWYKISQLSSIKMFSYYRIYDHEVETASGLCCGLIDADNQNKPAYEVYKYIDTQYSDYVTSQYLQYISYKNSKGEVVDNKTINSYLDVLDVFDSKYDFSNFNYSILNPQTVETVYEFEDSSLKMKEVVFNNQTFLYDGTSHTLKVTYIPDGVEVTYTDNVMSELGTKTVIATFTENGTVIGRRKATITISRMITNKLVYNYGEKIFVTVSRDREELDQDAWVGIFNIGAQVGNANEYDYSYYYFYFNRNNDDFIRTYAIQDSIYNKAGDPIEMPAGKYVIYYFKDGGYTTLYSYEIEVLPEGEISGTIDLSDVTFVDNEVELDGTVSLEIEGDMFDGVTVSYENNTLSTIGSIGAVVIFTYNEEVIEKRYAVLSTYESTVDRLVLNQESFTVGDDVLVTATSPASSNPSTWWVGLYLKGDQLESCESIYWYYVKDDKHISGQTYNIRTDASHNVSRAEFVDLPEGEYSLYLFNTSGYTVEKKIDFVINKVDIPEDNVEATLSKTQYFEKENILVTVDVPSTALSTYYFGLYLKSDDITTVNPIYTTNVSSAQATYNVKEGTRGDRSDLLLLPVNEYKVVLFKGEGEVVNTCEFSIVANPNPVITTNKTTYNVGEVVLVSAVTTTDGAWVALYLESDVLKTVASIYWYYVSDANHVVGNEYNVKSGELSPTRQALKDLPVGKYKVYILKGDYEEEASSSFEVVANANSNIYTNKTTYQQGEDVLVTATSTTSGVWVSLLLSTDQIGVAYSIYWYYVSDANHQSGNTYNIKAEELSSNRADLKDLPAGNYLVCVIREDYSVESIWTFTIENKLQLNKNTYKAGEDVLVTATSSTSGAWVAIYAKGDTVGSVDSIYWYYVCDDAHASGQEYNIKTGVYNSTRSAYENLPKGEYTIYILSGNYEVEASYDITVTE